MAHSLITDRLHRRALLRLATGGVSLAGIGIIAACGGSAAVTTTLTSNATVASAASQTSALTVSRAQTTTVQSRATSVATTQTVATTAASTQPASSTASVATSATTKMTFWGVEGGLAPTDPSTSLMQQTVRAFMQAHPEITVDFTPTGVGNDGQTKPKILANVAAGTPPDAFFLSREYIPSWATQGLLQPIDSYMAADKVSPSTFFSVAYDACVWRGKSYGLPNMLEIWVQYYNKDLFQSAGLNSAKPPVTLDDITSVAPKLTQKGANNTVTRAGYIPLWGNDGWYGLLRQWGSTLFSADGRQAQATTTASLDSLTWQADFINRTYGSNAAMQTNVKAWGKGGGFVNGQVAIWEDWHWSMGRWADEGGRGLYGDYFKHMHYGAAPVVYPKAGKEVIIPGGWAFVIAKAAKEPVAAWKFISFAMSAAGQKILRSGKGKNHDVVSGNRTFEEDRLAQMQAENPNRPMFLDQANHHLVAWEQSQVDYASMMWKYLNLVYDGKTSPKAGLEQMNEALQGALNKLTGA